MNKRKAMLYMALAILPALFTPDHAPQTAWEWFKYLGVAVYQGLLALKTFESKPESGKPEEVKIVNTTANPVPTSEAGDSEERR